MWLFEQLKNRLYWTISTLIFIGALIFVLSSYQSFLPSSNLPFSIPLSIAYKNVTTNLFCYNGISSHQNVIRGDTLLCIITVNNLQDNMTGYTVNIEQSPALSSGTRWNHDVILFTKINSTTYESEDIFMPVPDSPNFYLLIKFAWRENETKQDTFSVGPFFIKAFSDTEIRQMNINAKLFLITTIIALLGIFPAMESFRNLWSKKERKISLTKILKKLGNKRRNPED